MIKNDLLLLISVLCENSTVLSPLATLAESHKDEIAQEAKILAPKISDLLNSSYIGLSTISQNIPSDFSKVLNNKNSRFLPYALAIGATGILITVFRGAIFSKK